MNNIIRNQEIISKVSELSGVDKSSVEYILKCFKLVILNDILESQMSDSSHNILNYQDFKINIDKRTINFSNEFKDIISKIVIDGYDPLSESITRKFDKRILDRIKSSGLI